MASNSPTSILRVVALIAVIIAAVYFIFNEADDDELEIEIGLVLQAVPQQVATPYAQPFLSSIVLEPGTPPALHAAATRSEHDRA
jgi:hypothetical protein